MDIWTSGFRFRERRLQAPCGAWPLRFRLDRLEPPPTGFPEEAGCLPHQLPWHFLGFSLLPSSLAFPLSSLPNTPAQITPIFFFCKAIQPFPVPTPKFSSGSSFVRAHPVHPYPPPPPTIAHSLCCGGPVGEGETHGSSYVLRWPPQSLAWRCPEQTEAPFKITHESWLWPAWALSPVGASGSFSSRSEGTKEVSHA